MASSRGHVWVIGAGVAGLTSGLCLLRRGFDVTIVSSAFSPHITSDNAGALMEPAWSENPAVPRWYAATVETFSGMAGGRNSPDNLCGVFMGTFYTAFQSGSEGEASNGEHGVEGEPGLPSWASEVPPGTIEVVEPPATLSRDVIGDDAWAWKMSVPFVDMSKYMPYLMRRFLRQGGRVAVDNVSSFSDRRFTDAVVVVNCTGNGAAKLCGDAAMVPTRGVTVKVRVPGIDHGSEHLDLSTVDPLYIIPRTDDVVVLGGTYGKGDMRPTVSSEEFDAIVSKCASLDRRLPYPLTEDDVEAVSVGWRPHRKGGVRLEAEVTDAGLLVVHNYGHGGAGVSLSWGCAGDVVKLVEAAFAPKSRL